MRQSGPKPVAVLISDIHFTIPTLELATKSLNAALDMAEQLNVPCIVAGDTLDSKAIIRGECANRLLDIFIKHKLTQRTYVLVGNHDLLNEKGKEHSLNFLNAYVDLVQSPVFVSHLGLWMLPYMSDKEELQKVLGDTPKGSTIIMHQGVQGAWMGHYVQDKAALPNDVFANYRVISGHYHRAQNIECGPIRKGAVGLFSYIGTPYTMSFAEAGDGPKGFQILFDDGTMEQIPLNLRKHIVIEATVADIGKIDKGPIGREDLLWLKVRGTRAELDCIDKVELGTMLIGHANFKLDKICEESPREEIKVEQFTDEELFDRLIDNTNEEPDQKVYLKSLWREVLSK